MAQQHDKVALLRVHNPPSSARGGPRRAGATNEITDACLPDRRQGGRQARLPECKPARRQARLPECEPARRQARLPECKPARRQVSDPCDPWIDPNHDAAGSMSSAPAPGNEAARLHLKYDAWNRLVQVRNDPPSRVPPLRRAGADGEPNALIAIYRYDLPAGPSPAGKAGGLNRRVRKLLPDANGTACDFYYNEAWQVLEVRKDANAAPYKQYAWDIRYIDAPVLRWCDHNADGDFDLDANEIVYYVNDAQFNTTAIVDANSAKVLERYRYDPYGRVTVLNGDPAVDPDHARDANFTEWTADPNGTSDWDNEVLYCGYRHDWETGLKHVRHRMLHSTAGRWVQRDPLAGIDGTNPYQCVKGNPLAYRDPLGLASQPATQPALPPSYKPTLPGYTIEAVSIFTLLNEGRVGDAAAVDPWWSRFDIRVRESRIAIVWLRPRVERSSHDCYQGYPELSSSLSLAKITIRIPGLNPGRSMFFGQGWIKDDKEQTSVYYDKSFVDRTREHEVAHAEAHEYAAKTIDEQYVKLALEVRTRIHFSEPLAKEAAQAMLDELFGPVDELFEEAVKAATDEIHKDSSRRDSHLRGFLILGNDGGLGDWRAAIDRVLATRPLKAPKPR